jgi:hypothetical protein
MLRLLRRGKQKERVSYRVAQLGFGKGHPGLGIGHPFLLVYQVITDLSKTFRDIQWE